MTVLVDAPSVDHLAARERSIDVIHPDGLIIELDEGIASVVIILWEMGIDTEASCEGHEDWGESIPWIDISPRSVPKLSRSLSPGVVMVPLGIFGAMRLTTEDVDRFISRRRLLNFVFSLSEDAELPQR